MSDGRGLFFRSLLLFGMCKLLRLRRRFFVEGRFGISGEGFLLTSYGLQLLQCSVAFGCPCWSNRMQPAARKQWSGCRVRFRVQGIGYIELLRGKIAVRLYMACRDGEQRSAVLQQHFVAQRRGKSCSTCVALLQKYFHVFVNISRLRGQVWVKSFLDGVKVL